MKYRNPNFKVYFLLFFLLSSVVLSQSESNTWTRVSGKELNQKKAFRNSKPNESLIYSLNINELKNKLVNAPKRSEVSRKSNLILEFPDNEGLLHKYRIAEVSIFEKSLQEKYPNIRSYIGESIDNSGSTIRFSLSSNSFHGMTLRTNNGTQFIDRHVTDKQNYIVYSKSELTANMEEFVCRTEKIVTANRSSKTQPSSNMNDGQLRTFRLALAATVEYSQFHLTNQGVDPEATDEVKKAAVLAAMNTTMTRVNGIYEDELSVTMMLVANNTEIIYLVEPDPYDNGDEAGMLQENQDNVDAVIGNDNYDIGHVFGTGGGGAAWLGEVCVTGNKAGGVTGSSTPIGAAFDIDYVAHEMGHQYGANHTQNNDCSSNSSTSAEPGSASTIMGYAGICSPNVQNNSDGYFHIMSVQEIWNYVTTDDGTCAVQTPTGNNNSPTVSDLTSYNIPKSTPFILRGNGTDNGAGVLSFGWEQMDTETATMSPVSTSTVGPMFRSLQPSVSTDRYMPKIETVVAGSIESTWEVVPTVARVMNFNLTVRDNDPSGGRFTTKSMTVTTEDVDPFLVSAPNSSVTWNVNSTETVTWDVGSTTNGTINCNSVNIRLSIDGGLTYPTLIETTTNDGSEEIIVPNYVSTNCRIMVEAADNIFYDISNSDFTIEAALGVDNEVFEGLNVFPNPSNGTINISLQLNSTEKVEVLLFDVVGRKVGSNTFENNSLLFNEKLSYSNLSGGIYILKLTQGSKSSSRKIVLQ